MGSEQLLNLGAGTVVNGRYEIIKCLGTGSMGRVYACRHLELANLVVAMKVLFAEVARDEIACQRFRNEIVSSYGVSNPYVVRAFEYFRDEEIVAFTMEYVEGGDLADRLDGEELIPIPEIIRLFSQMCSGVQAIHDAGIVHRDLKPENILLTENGDIKITDFGIAKTGSGPRLTEHGGVVGTIDYVSPEYLEYGQVDKRSDIYALGILGYEMITGMAPYKGKSVVDTMTMRLKTDPFPPHEIRSECPVELSCIIQRAMSRDPLERYQNASEILSDLEEFGGGSKGVVLTPHSIASEETAAYEHTGEEKPDEGGTMEIDQSLIAEISKGPSIEDLQPEEEPPARVGRKVVPTLSSGSNVSISSSHLSPERMQALSAYRQTEEHFFPLTLRWLFVLFVASGVGLYILRRFRPDLFGSEIAGSPFLEDRLINLMQLLR